MERKMIRNQSGMITINPKLVGKCVFLVEDAILGVVDCYLVINIDV